MREHKMKLILIMIISALPLSGNADVKISENINNTIVTVTNNDEQIPNQEEEDGEVEELISTVVTNPVSYFETKYSFKNTMAKATTTANPSLPSFYLMTNHSTTTKVMSTVNTTPIFWGASWANPTLASDKITGLVSFYSNINTSTYKSTVSEYTTLNHRYITSLLDTTTIASSDIVTVANKVCNLLTANNSIDANGYYPVYTDLPRNGAGFCGYHSAAVCNGTTIQYAFFFNVNDDVGCDPASTFAPPAGSVGSQKPGTGTTVASKASLYQQSQGLAALANISAHELMETVTDPWYVPPTGTGYYAGWYDSIGWENGDKCAWTFGPSKTKLAAGTVVVGNMDWKLQGQWSNKALTAKTGYTTSSPIKMNGCVTGS